VYPDALRRVSYLDVETRKRFKFLTNNFVLPALTIAEIYKCRWQVELFFKWIKQHLRIKAFYGTSENALKTQIWIAVFSLRAGGNNSQAPGPGGDPLPDPYRF
jgi:transposase